MSPPTDSPLDDELISAVLDGEVSEEDRRRVLDDPTARARLERFRRISDHLSAPVTPDASARDRVIQEVLETWQLGEPTPAVASRSAPAGRSPSRRRRVLAVAAGVLVALAIPAALTLSRAGDRAPTRSELAQRIEPEASGAERRSEDTAAASGPEADSNVGQERSSTASSDERPLSSPARVELGVFADPLDLQEAVRAAWRTSQSTTSPSGRAAMGVPETAMPDTSCSNASAAAADPSAGPPIFLAAATSRGTPVHIDVYRSTNSSSPLAVVIRPSTCEVLARFTL